MITPASPVTSATTEKLRKAMQRLLEGRPQHCDGTLTKANLAREACISPATLYRATTILADWDRTVTDATPRNPSVADLENRLAEANRTIRDLRRKNAELQRKLTASITVTAELHALLAAERERNHRSKAKVTALHL